ncbi:MAG: SUMF1/EgtB/PvdO family nonheme iron enzyme [Deltaproteobacteria bacterium]|nr:SUMF1/EgtB/PvdO family nonheme iron enzyme [Deltaproteobacteria bacterium]
MNRAASIIIILSILCLIPIPGSPLAKELPQAMVYIPEGEFIMGGDDDPGNGIFAADETPKRKVELKPFYIDRYEVTNKQYKEFLDAVKRQGVKGFEHYMDEGIPIPDKWDVDVLSGGGMNRTFFPGEENDPVVDVDWYMANAYCKFYAKGLPTEEQWEKAAKGTDGRMYPWGNEYKPGWSNNREYWEKKGAAMDEWKVLPVGSFPKDASVYGVYDMAGNALEWTANLYRPYPGSALKRDIFNAEVYVLRGGAHNLLLYEFGRVTSRHFRQPTDNREAHAEWHTDMNIGFRCAKDAE